MFLLLEIIGYYISNFNTTIVIRVN